MEFVQINPLKYTKKSPRKIFCFLFSFYFAWELVNKIFKELKADLQVISSWTFWTINGRNTHTHTFEKKEEEEKKEWSIVGAVGQ